MQSFFKPNCSHIYFLLGCRCENYAITLLEQCENLEEVENFLQTKPQEGTTNTNYILAILDSRKKFVAHERFQYVLLKNFGETDLPVSLCLQLLIMISFWVCSIFRWTTYFKKGPSGHCFCFHFFKRID